MTNRGIKITIDKQKVTVKYSCMKNRFHCQYSEQVPLPVQRTGPTASTADRPHCQYSRQAPLPIQQKGPITEYRKLVTFGAIEFTAVSLLPAAAADIDITVMPLVAH